jgi:hypothetical protein
MGRSVHGVDLTQPLTPEQAKLIVGMLDDDNDVSFAGQDQSSFSATAVYIVTNLVGSGPDKQEQVAGSLHWHNDIEFELNLVPITRLYRHANAGSTQRVNWKDFSLYRDETPENRPFIDMHSLDPQVSSHLNSANEIE